MSLPLRNLTPRPGIMNALIDDQIFPNLYQYAIQKATRVIGMSSNLTLALIAKKKTPRDVLRSSALPRKKMKSRKKIMRGDGVKDEAISGFPVPLSFQVHQLDPGDKQLQQFCPEPEQSRIIKDAASDSISPNPSYAKCILKLIFNNRAITKEHDNSPC